MVLLLREQANSSVSSMSPPEFIPQAIIRAEYLFVSSTIKSKSRVSRIYSKLQRYSTGFSPTVVDQAIRWPNNYSSAKAMPVRRLESKVWRSVLRRGFAKKTICNCEITVSHCRHKCSHAIQLSPVVQERMSTVVEKDTG